MNYYFSTEYYNGALNVIKNDLLKIVHLLYKLVHKNPLLSTG